MQRSHHLFIIKCVLLLAPGNIFAASIAASAGWGQEPASSIPLSQSVPSEILGSPSQLPLQSATEVGEFPLSGPNPPLKTTSISTQAADLLPANATQNLASEPSPPAETGAPTAQTGTSEKPGSGTSPPPVGGQVVIPIGGENNKPFKFGFGSPLGIPTILNGMSRHKVVAASKNTLQSFGITAYLRQLLGDDQDLLLVFSAERGAVGFDLSYNIKPASLPGVFSINLSNQQSQSPAFAEGNLDVDLPNGDPPYVYQTGGGIQYFQQVNPRFGFAVGANYQLISVRDGLFSSSLDPEDALGNPLTVSSDGQDTMFTLNAAALYDSTDNRNYPTQGTRFQAGFAQSIPVGQAQITFTRLDANLTQFIPLYPFRSVKPHVLVLNAQGGTFIGDVPPYGGYNLGGPNTVRGFSTGELGTGSSFVEVSAEYRIPLFSFKLRKKDVDIVAALFLDYANDLGTQSEVIGQPGLVRDKPGEGLGYGVGLQAKSPIGFLRLEVGWNDQGETAVYILGGDRF
jgi:outer membrane protein insertion porin family